VSSERTISIDGTAYRWTEEEEEGACVRVCARERDR
jgi:hypothetical protein